MKTDVNEKTSINKNDPRNLEEKMFRKLIIAVLALGVVAAVVVSIFNIGPAYSAQSAAAQASNKQAELVVNSDTTGLSSTISQTTAGTGQSGASRKRGGGGNSGGYRGGRSEGAANGIGQGGGLQSLPPAGELNDIEAQSLAFMVEEEKLARDVYLALYEKWGLVAFQNISRSEQQHMDAIGQLINRYGLNSPVQAVDGVFTDPALQALYTDLVARGSTSLADAIKVGGLIEEIDILDLQSRLVETDNADIQQVYGNLLNGSYNHLRAFSNTLSLQTGESYQPQKLSADAYGAILSGSQGGGNGQGQRNGSGGGGNGRGGRTGK